MNPTAKPGLILLIPPITSPPFATIWCSAKDTPVKTKASLFGVPPPKIPNNGFPPILRIGINDAFLIVLSGSNIGRTAHYCKENTGVGVPGMAGKK